MSIKKEEFNEIVGKYYSSTYRPITAPMYKHDVLGWDCLWGKHNVYLKEDYVLPKEKDLTISYIYAKQINGQYCSKGKDVDTINEKLKEDVFIKHFFKTTTLNLSNSKNSQDCVQIFN